MQEKIIAALKTLDPSNADHWTSEGAPRIDALKLEGVKRSDITAAAPHFSRDNPIIATPAVKEAEAAKLSLEAEVAKDKLLTLEEKMLIAQAEADEALGVLMVAKRKYDEAVARRDALTREHEVVGSTRKSIHDIMDFIDAQNKLRQEKVAARLKG